VAHRIHFEHFPIYPVNIAGDMSKKNEIKIIILGSFEKYYYLSSVA
jgi:hypothetical protein